MKHQHWENETDSFLEKSGGSNLPEFVEDIKNVTVASGREAVISCVVSNLGKYKVSSLSLSFPVNFLIYFGRSQRKW